MRHDHDCKGIGTLFEQLGCFGVIGQFHDGKLKTDLAAPQVFFEFTRFPFSGISPDHGKTCRVAAIPVIKPVIVHVHPLGKIFLPLNLDIRMDYGPCLVPVFQPDFSELVHILSARLRVPGDLLQFLVQEFISPGPVDVIIGAGKEEFDEFPEILFDDFLPGLS